MTFPSSGNNAQMQIVMLKRGDDGFDESVDAKQTFGPDWAKIVEKGINTCF